MFGDVLGGFGRMASSLAGYVGEKILGDGTYKEGSNDTYCDRDNSSDSSFSTLYEPDKVKVAKIEREIKLTQEHAKNDRIVLRKEAKMELAEFNAKMEVAVMAARARGLYDMQQALMSLLKEVNIVAEERFLLIENAHAEQIRRVEDMYAELAKDINNDSFMEKKIPELFQLLEQFPEGSDRRILYQEGIRQEITRHIQFKTQQLQQLDARRKVVVESVVAGKQQIYQHINEVVAKRIDHMEKVILSYKPELMPRLTTDVPVSQAQGTQKRFLQFKQD